ncbi:hypothetical protein FISHEDRAFT_58410 [Fistulina hepatica ATCC 64428]|nr:hypothetical protein FISHEDRAFT_58410 [Fistulina hepatica ATCC 64428]
MSLNVFARVSTHSWAMFPTMTSTRRCTKNMILLQFRLPQIPNWATFGITRGCRDPPVFSSSPIEIIAQSSRHYHQEPGPLYAVSGSLLSSPHCFVGSAPVHAPNGAKATDKPFCAIERWGIEGDIDSSVWLPGAQERLMVTLDGVAGQSPSGDLLSGGLNIIKMFIPRGAASTLRRCALQTVELPVVMGRKLPGLLRQVIVINDADACK